jgi:hypothetical protein
MSIVQAIVHRGQFRGHFGQFDRYSRRIGSIESKQGSLAMMMIQHHDRWQQLPRMLRIAFSLWLGIAYSLLSVKAFTTTSSSNYQLKTAKKSGADHLHHGPQEAATPTRIATTFRLQSTAPRNSSSSSSKSTSTSTTTKASSVVDELKADLYNAVMMKSSSPVDAGQIRVLVDQICAISSASSGGADDYGDDGINSNGINSNAMKTRKWLSGEWELLYGTDEITRSSPFFTAFRQAFPDSAVQIFDITDNIRTPWKETGPAYQEIELNDSSGSGASGGRLVSRVKVATLGGKATSIMTTRCTILAGDGSNGSWTLQVDTTKPEESTILKTLFGEFLAKTVDANLLPPFPSGMALERVMPGSSQVVWQNPFCDESMRISRYGTSTNDFCIWQRKEFSLYEPL